jgi:hypothetical protein
MVGDGGKSPSHLPGLTRMSKKEILQRFVMLVVAVIIVAALVIFAKDFSHRNVAFRIDGKNYSKKTISEMATYASKQNGQSKQSNAKNIYSLYKTEIAAKKEGIAPTADELKVVAKLPGATTDAEKQYVDLVQFNNALTQAYQRNQQGGYAGQEFVFDYSARISPAPQGITPVSGFGNPTLIKQDQQYAHQQAEAFYNKYKQNPASANQLNAQLRTMNKLGFIAGMSQFGPSQSSNLQSQIYYPDIYKYVITQSKPVLSGVRSGNVPTVLKPTSSQDYTPGYYYFVNITQAGKVVDAHTKVVDAEKKMGSVYYGI